MKPHHKAWLDAHPERDAEWLARMVAEGFHVHHVDGDPRNNHPANLALIETLDHMRLHGLFGLVRPDIREAASKGGKTRMGSMTPEERADHCRMMAAKRWGHKVAKKKRSHASKRPQSAPAVPA